MTTISVESHPKSAGQAGSIPAEAAALIETIKAEIPSIKATDIACLNGKKQHATHIHQLLAYMTQRQAAEHLDVSLGYVNGYAQWHDGGFAGEPFAKASKEARQRRAAKRSVATERRKAKPKKFTVDQVKAAILALPAADLETIITFAISLRRSTPVAEAGASNGSPETPVDDTTTVRVGKASFKIGDVPGLQEKITAKIAADAPAAAGAAGFEGDGLDLRGSFLDRNRTGNGGDPAESAERMKVLHADAEHREAA